MFATNEILTHYMGEKRKRKAREISKASDFDYSKTTIDKDSKQKTYILCYSIILICVSFHCTLTNLTEQLLDPTTFYCHVNS